MSRDTTALNRPRNRRPRNVVLLGWVAFWSGMSQEMIYPLLPTFVVLALSSSRAVLGAIEGALVVGVTVARVVTARMLDRNASPRRLTRISYAISLVARPLMAAGTVLLVAGHEARGLRLAFALAAVPAIAAAFALRRIHDSPPPVRPAGSERLPLTRPFVVLLVAVTLFGLDSLVYAGFAYANAAWQLWLLFVAYGLYFASAEGTLKAWVASLVPPERRGAAYGLLAVASGLLVLPASVIAGGLWDRYGPRPAFLFGSALSALALAVVVLAPDPTRRTGDREAAE